MRKIESKVINLNLPHSFKIMYNMLYDLDSRGKYPPEDVLLVELPNNFFIDVSYHNDTDDYSIVVYKDEFDNKIMSTIRKTPIEIKRTIEAFGVLYESGIGHLYA